MVRWVVLNGGICSPHTSCLTLNMSDGVLVYYREGCSSVVRAFAHGAMGRSKWWRTFTTYLMLDFEHVRWCIGVLSRGM